MTSYGYIIMVIVHSCIIWFQLDCIMQLKKSYYMYIATNVSSRKGATTFGNLPDCLSCATIYCDWAWSLHWRLGIHMLKSSCAIYTGPFYWHKLTLIPARISNHLPSKVLMTLLIPFTGFDGCAVEVCEWISNFLLHVMVVVISPPCWNGPPATGSIVYTKRVWGIWIKRWNGQCNHNQAQHRLHM